MLGRSLRARAIAVGCLMFLAGPASAIENRISWTGTVLGVDPNAPMATYFGTAAGSTFSGSFVYGLDDSTAVVDDSEPNEADYEFLGAPFGGTVTDGTTPVGGSTSFVNVQNNFPLTQDEADLINLVLGGNVAAGTQVDVWSAGAISDGATFFDPTPGDDSDDDLLVNGFDFEIAFVDLDAALYASTDFQAMPPGIGDVDLAVFFVDEGDDAGTLLFSALGTLDSVSVEVVPEPSVFSLVALGLVGIAARRRG